MHMLGSIRDQSQMPGPLDSDGYRSLVLGAGASLTARINPASLRNISAQFAGVFIINYIDFVTAEGTDFPFGNVFGSLPLSLRFHRFGIIHSALTPYYLSK
jgi:hypothetical protein